MLTLRYVYIINSSIGYVFRPARISSITAIHKEVMPVSLVDYNLVFYDNLINFIKL